MLVDTHALLWWLLDDPRLSESARSEMRSATTEVFVSSASGWEIATKHRLGKLGLEGWDPETLPQLLRRDRFEQLPVTLEHGIAAGFLAGRHRDPFDRMLIAQSRAERMPVVTADPVFAAYDVPVIW